VEAKHAEGEKRYKIHRIIKEKVTLDDLLEFKNKDAVDIAVKVFLKLGTIEGGGQEQFRLFLYFSGGYIGFKLDYLEVWNWGTFDQKVYCMNTQGNNSLLTGANAFGQEYAIDALLTLFGATEAPTILQQSSGVEKKGNRTEESYFFGNYGNQQQEGAASTTTLRLRDKGARSVLLASFCNVDNVW